MKYKIRVRYYDTTRITVIENWLYDMQKKGWMIIAIVFNVFVFIRNEKVDNNIFIFTISFGAKLFEVMYRENIMINGVYEGHQITTISAYQCFAIPKKYSNDIKKLYNQRSRVFMQLLKEKIVLCSFLEIIFIIMSIASIFGETDLNVHFVSIPIALLVLLLFCKHSIEYFKLKKMCSVNVPPKPPVPFYQEVADINRA